MCRLWVQIESPQAIQNMPPPFPLRSSAGSCQCPAPAFEQYSSRDELVDEPLIGPVARRVDEERGATTSAEECMDVKIGSRTYAA